MWPAPVKLAGRLPCQTVVLTQFLGPEDSAMLRLSADVFILAIRTDAFSASMQEYLYAGACVLKGACAGLSQLEDMGIELESFRDFADIPALVARAMDGALTGLAPGQRALFPRLYSWRPCGRAGCPSTADYLPPMGRPISM